MIGKENEKGFTLVELVVVLVILAILAAILVPALLSYIDASRQKQDILKARAFFTAAQAEFVECYSQRKDTDKVALPGYPAGAGGSGKDVNMKNTDIAKKIRKTADEDPYVFVVGLGRYDTYKNTDIHKCYTCYFGIYMKDANSDPLYFDGSKWSERYPWIEEGLSNGTNKFKVGSETIDMQMYIINNGYSNDDTMWRKLQDIHNKKYKK